jgi:DNA-binding CsgD family transcriptional regulator
MLTTFDLDEYVYEAMKAGASGFLLKDAPRGQLIGAVRTVAAGEALLAPALVRRLIEDFVARPAPGASPPAELDELTERELEVLTLIARGLANAEIATRLFLSEATVRTHVTHILAKLGRVWSTDRQGDARNGGLKCAPGRPTSAEPRAPRACLPDVGYAARSRSRQDEPRRG